MTSDEMRARRLVEARLGRPPQDALEAAVVLEAWAGVPAQRALETARAMMTSLQVEPLVSRAAPAPVQKRPRLLVEGIAFVVTVAGLALWAAPLADALGASVVRTALLPALPVTLALQWALLSRHLGRPSGLGGLVARRGELAACAVALVVGPGVLLGGAGWLAGVLIVTWTGGALVIRRGWAVSYCALVLGALALLLAGVAAPAVVAGVAAAVALAAVLALSTVPASSATPGRWSRALGAAGIGAAIGALLVADDTVTWTSSAAPALALLPSAAGALWASRRLWTLPALFPRALAGTPARPVAPRRGAPKPSRGPALGPPRRVLRGTRRGRHDASTHSPQGAALAPARSLLAALWRFGAVTVAGSLALALWLPAAEAGVLAAYGAVALATLLVGVLDSLGRPLPAAVGIACGVGVAVLVRALEAPFAGAALLMGGVCAAAILLVATLAHVARPARTLATTLWIS